MDALLTGDQLLFEGRWISRSVLEEEPGNLRVASVGCAVERCESILARRVYRGPILQQNPHHLQVAIGRRRLRGVTPCLVARVISAPCFTRYSTTCEWPREAAKHSGAHSISLSGVIFIHPMFNKDLDRVQMPKFGSIANRRLSIHGGDIGIGTEAQQDESSVLGWPQVAAALSGA